MVKLRVENGVLLREYFLPYSRRLGRHVTPPKTWTQDRDDRVQQLADEIMAEAAEHLDDGADQSRELALQVAERIVRNELAKREGLVRGWVPVMRDTKRDRQMIEAFKRYWVEMHPELDDLSIEFVTSKPVPDGYYIYSNGRIVPLG